MPTACHQAAASEHPVMCSLAPHLPQAPPPSALSTAPCCAGLGDLGGPAQECEAGPPAVRGVGDCGSPTRRRLAWLGHAGEAGGGYVTLTGWRTPPASWMYWCI